MNRSVEWQLRARIYSLLREPANLRFIRVFKTDGWFDSESTVVMNRLMPLLREDFLTEFSYTVVDVSCFPTPLQLQLLLGRQKNLRNLKLYSHMVRWMEKFLNKLEPSQRVRLFKSFTELDIGSSWHCRVMTLTTACWPLKNLDSCLLQSLSHWTNFFS